MFCSKCFFNYWNFLAVRLWDSGIMNFVTAVQRLSDLFQSLNVPLMRCVIVTRKNWRIPSTRFISVQKHSSKSLKDHLVDYVLVRSNGPFADDISCFKFERRDFFASASHSWSNISGKIRRAASWKSKRNTVWKNSRCFPSEIQVWNYEKEFEQLAIKLLLIRSLSKNSILVELKLAKVTRSNIFI